MSEDDRREMLRRMTEEAVGQRDNPCLTRSPVSSIADQFASIKSLREGIFENAVTPEDVAFNRLQELIANFQGRLGHQHEIGVCCANVEAPFHFRKVDLVDTLIFFEGVDSAGQDVLAVQHYAQLSVQFVKVKKLKEQPKSVGFMS